MEGWISLHRKFLEWEWFDDKNMVVLFIYLLLKANHAPVKWQGIDINKGEFVTSINKLSQALNISEQSVRTCLKRLEKTGEINKQSNTKLTKIIVCNYDSYQDAQQTTNKQTNKRVTNEQQTTNKQLTTNNNDNKNNKNNNVNKKEYTDDVRKLLRIVFNYFPEDVKEKIKTNKSQQNAWLDTIDKLNRIDGYELDLIRDVIIYAREDSFWSGNFLSIAALRKSTDGTTKFQKIKAQYDKSKPKNETKEERLKRLIELQNKM